jgi:hypothetical protein
MDQLASLQYMTQPRSAMHSLMNLRLVQQTISTQAIQLQQASLILYLIRLHRYTPLSAPLVHIHKLPTIQFVITAVTRAVIEIEEEDNHVR